MLFSGTAVVGFIGGINVLRCKGIESDDESDSRRQQRDAP